MNLDVTTALSIIGATSALVWLIIRLSLRPVESDVAEIKAVISKVKSEEELKRMIRVDIMRHEKECRQDRISETGSMRVQSKG